MNLDTSLETDIQVWKKHSVVLEKVFQTWGCTSRVKLFFFFKSLSFMNFI